MSKVNAYKQQLAGQTFGSPSRYTAQIIYDACYYADNYKDIGDKIPSIAGLSRYLKITRDTLYRWAKDDKKQDFKNIMDSILSEQEASLLNNGLDGTFNPHITKLVLSKHGYGDNSNNNKGISITINRDCTHVESDNESIIIDHDEG